MRGILLLRNRTLRFCDRRMKHIYTYVYRIVVRIMRSDSRDIASEWLRESNLLPRENRPVTRATTADAEIARISARRAYAYAEITLERDKGRITLATIANRSAKTMETCEMKAGDTEISCSSF